jgi:hypothetical protein
VPVPSFWNAPPPEITPENVNVSEWLMANSAPVLTATSPRIEPVAPPLPSISAPALIVVPPL